MLFKINARKDEGVDLAKSYGVQGFPTFVVATHEGETLERWWGYESPEKFVPTLQGALADPTTIEQKRARLEKKPNAPDALKLAMYHETRDEYEDAVKYYRQAQKLAPQENYTFEIFDVVASGTRNEVFTLDQAKKAADAVLQHEQRDVMDVMRVARMMTSLGRKLEDHTVMVPYLKVAMRESEGVEDEDAVKNRKRVAVEHALFVDKDAAKAVAYRKEMLDEGWMEDADQLNAFAWWCFENKINLEEADRLARKGVELAADKKTKAMILDTVAEICNLRGSCKDAVYYIELAIQADPDNTYFQEQLERFQKLLAEKE